MMKKVSVSVSALLLALLLLAATVTVFAASASVVDDSANVFSTSESEEIRSRFDKAADKTGWQMIVYTSNQGVGSNLNNYYNANYYDTHSYDANAVLLVFDTGSNKGTVITHGDAMHYISDQRMSDLGFLLRGYMNSGSYYQGALAFAEKIEEYYSAGIPEDGTFDNISYNEKQDNKLLYTLKKGGWLIGLLSVAAGLIFFFVNKSRYKNMGKSGTYDLSANSDVQLTEAQDDFVTQHTTVRTIQRDNNSSGGSSGGSTHGGGDF